MNKSRFFLIGGLLPAIALCGIVAARSQNNLQGDTLTTPDSTGLLRTITSSGTIDTRNPFFLPLGTNGRACVTCHVPQDGWSINPADLQQRFNATGGSDPIFRLVDGSNSPLADVSTLAARRRAYSMLLNRGLIRIGIGIPAGAEFSLVGVDDPYGYASAHELSLFRRPLPATNLRFLTGVQWDARDTVHPFLPPMDAGQNRSDLVASLALQAVQATLGHEQAAAPPTDDQLSQIVSFEMGLSTAQVFDNQAGWLNEDDALGGPRVLMNHEFYVGINDTLGADPTGDAFNPSAMSLFKAWENLRGGDERRGSRKAIARGELLFNTKQFQITGVGGLNDALNAPVIVGTCTTCHNSPNVGDHSVALPINIGVSDASRRTPDMPLYTLQNNTTGETVQTTDPGRALITGKWRDIGKFKGPILHGLAARAPYFHNGSAATLDDVLNFYDTRFNIGFTKQEKSDLVAFLRSL